MVILATLDDTKAFYRPFYWERCHTTFWAFLLYCRHEAEANVRGEISSLCPYYSLQDIKSNETCRDKLWTIPGGINNGILSDSHHTISSKGRSETSLAMQTNDLPWSRRCDLPLWYPRKIQQTDSPIEFTTRLADSRLPDDACLNNKQKATTPKGMYLWRYPWRLTGDTQVLQVHSDLSVLTTLLE